MKATKRLVTLCLALVLVFACLGLMAPVLAAADEYTVGVGQTLQLPNIFIAIIDGRSIIWRSSNPTIADVDNIGRVTGIHVGFVVISCTYQDLMGTWYSNDRYVTVVAAPVEISLSPTSLSLTVGDKWPLTATVIPDGVALDDIFWNSNNLAVARVGSRDGVVTAISPGNAVITAYIMNMSFSAACTVAVTQPEQTSGVSLSGLVRSNNPLQGTTLQLLQGNSEAIYEITIPAETTGFGQITQPFAFENVQEGEYALAITKPGHTSFRIENVIIGDKDVDFTQDSRSGASLMNLRCGDINGDGMINDGDLSILWMLANYNRDIDKAANPMCDLNGDGLINDGDLTILWQTEHYNKGAIVIP